MPDARAAGKSDNYGMERWPGPWTVASWTRTLASGLALPAAVTLLATPRTHPRTTVVAVLYVLAVVLAARIGGAVAGVVAGVVSFLALNFFFTPPLHTFAVSSQEDLVALFVFLATAVVVGLLLSSTVDAKARAERRELEARLVKSLATQLLSGATPKDVLEEFARRICDGFAVARCEIRTTLTGPVTVERAVVHTEPHVAPIVGRARLGDLVVWSADDRPLKADVQSAIESLATQLALALEGVRLAAEVRRAELEAQASQLKAALFSGVTHDVKTPLAAITTAVTSLIDGAGFSEVDRRAHLDTIRDEADRLHRVVNNLLDVARLRAGALEPAKKSSAIDELMESVIGRLRPLLEGRSIEMRIADNVPEVPMDVVQIDQVLTNLLENAAKFTTDASPISLMVVGNEQAVRVTVADRGPGVPKDERHRIFEPFERAEGSVAGTGLGLALSKAIVEAHGGRMWVSDNPAGGAAFTFELPCIAPVGAEEVRDARAGARG